MNRILPRHERQLGQLPASRTYALPRNAAAALRELELKLRDRDRQRVTLGDRERTLLVLVLQYLDSLIETAGAARDLEARADHLTPESLEHSRHRSAAVSLTTARDALEAMDW